MVQIFNDSLLFIKIVIPLFNGLWRSVNLKIVIYFQVSHGTTSIRSIVIGVVVTVVVVIVVVLATAMLNF